MASFDLITPIHQSAFFYCEVKLTVKVITVYPDLRSCKYKVNLLLSIRLWSHLHKSTSMSST